MTQEHFEDLYKRLFDAYKECVEHDNQTYQQSIGQILDHMIYNRPYLKLK